MWTWISGSNVHGASAVHGTQGVPSGLNHPAAQYEQNQWKDKQGNLWLYGGMYPSIDDMWKYNPFTNEWTWMRGTGTATAPVYGTMGVSDPANYPGVREFGAATWTDTSGNLWLFGGNPLSVLFVNDLWKYDISTNEWTWVNGSNTSQIGAHGTQGIPGPLVQPGGRNEAYANWVDEDNNLWLYGGLGWDDFGFTGNLSDLMKYNISTNEWTWMKGANTPSSPPIFGTMGISSPSNEPGARITTSIWKDLQGNFWLFGGSDNPGHRNDLWKYDPLLNEWTWMRGPDTIYDPGSYQSNCIYDSINWPEARYESRASVTDYCGNFWMFGGNSPAGKRNDLWVFNPQLLQWNWVCGSSLTSQPG